MSNSTSFGNGLATAVLICFHMHALMSQGMAGNIIHAIATTNAIIAGFIVIEAIKVLTGAHDACKVILLVIMTVFLLPADSTVFCCCCNVALANNVKTMHSSIDFETKPKCSIWVCQLALLLPNRQVDAQLPLSCATTYSANARGLLPL